MSLMGLNQATDFETELNHATSLLTRENPYQFLDLGFSSEDNEMLNQVKVDNA